MDDEITVWLEQRERGHAGAIESHMISVARQGLPAIRWCSEMTCQRVSQWVAPVPTAEGLT